MSITAPFATRPSKPQVTRLPDGRIGVFMGSAYQFTDDDGARSLRDQIDELLAAPTPSDIRAGADGEFCQQLAVELAAKAIA